MPTANTQNPSLYVCTNFESLVIVKTWFESWLTGIGDESCILPCKKTKEDFYSLWIPEKNQEQKLSQWLKTSKHASYEFSRILFSNIWFFPPKIFLIWNTLQRYKMRLWEMIFKHCVVLRKWKMGDLHVTFHETMYPVALAHITHKFHRHSLRSLIVE